MDAGERESWRSGCCWDGGVGVVGTGVGVTTSSRHCGVWDGARGLVSGIGLERPGMVIG